MQESRSLLITRQALRDLAEIAAYYGAESTDLERRFLNSAERTCRMLAYMPGMGASLKRPRGRLWGLRFVPVRGFPNILVFYRSRDCKVEVIRVLHGARDFGKLLPDT